METIQALLLAFLEMLFIFVALGLLHSQRGVIGKAPFYMASGLLLLFSHFISAAECQVAISASLEFDLGFVAVFLPILAAFLMVYISDGTLEAQRMIIGAVVLFGFYLYLGEVTRIACNWLGVSVKAGISGPSLDLLLSQTRNSMNVSSLLRLVDFFIVPVVYTRLANLHWRRFFCIFGAFGAAVFATTLLRLLPGKFFGGAGALLNGNLIAEVVALSILSILLWGYFSCIERDVRTGERGPLDLLFAFFGSYGRSKELEADLREWTDRYQLILENAGELIIMMTPGGRIIDANIAAGKLLGQEPAALSGQRLFPHMSIMQPADYIPGGVPAGPVQFRCALEGDREEPVLLSCSLSPIRMRGRTLLVMIGRDITEEMKLADEKTRLAEQLAHSQRIESLGLLAGGIAHDFNNYVHAILGHIDVITMLHPPEDPEALRHLEKVTAIAEQAGHLTSQLLGFARKGKYQVVELDMKKLIEGCLAMLGPQKRRDMTIETEFAPDLPTVRGDNIQLQQVILNLLLNAVDATEGKEERLLRIVVTFATHAHIELEPPPDKIAKFNPADYICVEVSDNGSGMDEETRKRLFEPFFTTKAVGSGTGMGLAMVYGTITNHQGWIQVVTAPGEGAAFYLFLPRFVKESQEPCV